MRIGVDACCWINGRGYGRFTRELLRALVAQAPDDEFICFLDPQAYERFDLEGANVTRVRVAQSASPTDAAAADGSRSPIDMIRLTRAVWRTPLDVFFSPTVYTYFPLPPGLPALISVLDAIAERFPELTLPSPRARLFWRAKVWLALRQARLILTLSRYTAGELERILAVEPRRIRISGAAASPIYRPSEDPGEVAEAARKVGLEPGVRWFVYVGGFNPHKHVDTIVRAHAALARRLGAAAPHLLLVGTTHGDVFHGDLDRIRATIRETGVETLVHWTGFLPDETLRHLHSGAIALLMPSECEGFGLPAVEAAACGAPVIATTESPLPELLEGGGRFVAPGDEAALAAAMRELATDETVRRSLGATARDRAMRLSWPASGAAVLAALREAAGR